MILAFVETIIFGFLRFVIIAVFISELILCVGDRVWYLRDEETDDCIRTPFFFTIQFHNGHCRMQSSEYAPCREKWLPGNSIFIIQLKVIMFILNIFLF